MANSGSEGAGDSIGAEDRVDLKLYAAPSASLRAGRRIALFGERFGEGEILHNLTNVVFPLLHWLKLLGEWPIDDAGTAASIRTDVIARRKPTTGAKSHHYGSNGRKD